jgi:hypothetical protein
VAHPPGQLRLAAQPQQRGTSQLGPAVCLLGAGWRCDQAQLDPSSMRGSSAPSTAAESTSTTSRSGSWSCWRDSSRRTFINGPRRGQARPRPPGSQSGPSGVVLRQIVPDGMPFALHAFPWTARLCGAAGADRVNASLLLRAIGCAGEYQLGGDEDSECVSSPGSCLRRRRLPGQGATVDRTHWSVLPGARRGRRERHDPPAGLRRLGPAEVLADDEQALVLPSAERAGEAAASGLTVARTSPPSRTRTQCWLPQPGGRSAIPPATNLLEPSWVGQRRKRHLAPMPA